MEEEIRCRSCGANDLRTFLDLGTTPLADALVHPTHADRPESRFPLAVAFCSRCALVQITTEVPPEKLFVDNYLYFSSFSDALLGHARGHARALVDRCQLGDRSFVVELASNDGYLLRNFVELGIPVLGIDPAPEQAIAAEAAGVPTLAAFFSDALAHELVERHGHADVIIANNVMAHVPDLNGFVAGMARLLADDGVITVENPYVRDLIVHREFDTIYHEHFCYFSCTSVDQLVQRHGLRLNDVDYFPDLHGGTLRWWISKRDERSVAAQRYLDQELASGLCAFDYYRDFAAAVYQIRDRLKELLHQLTASGARIAAYGAAAKGSTLLNFAEVGPDLIEYIVDRNVHKQGLLMPGVHVPIREPDALLRDQPDYLLLLAWNFKDEIMQQQAEYARKGGRFIVPIPEPTIVGAP